MKTFVSSLVLLATLNLSGASLLRAKEPPPAPRKGKVLILHNEKTLEGDIEHVGDTYRVRQGKGEAWVPADRVLCLAASMPDAYQYLRGRINREDADERVRLSRWCHDHALREQAIAELHAAAALRPDHAETRRLLERWQHEIVAETAPKPTAPLPPPLPVDKLPPIEVTTESLGQFATRVQPILMNTCARCHATGRGGKFQLKQVYEDGLGNRRTLEQNLAAVLREVNLNQPEMSRLLTKAVSDHAHTGQAPLRDRQAAPYRTLETWIKLTVTNNPHLRELLPSAPALPASTPVPPPPAVERRGSQETSEWGADTHPVASPTPPTTTPTTSTPAPPDPYDPEPFNQRTHPETRKPGPGK
jgi:hypothetical protein